MSARTASRPVPAQASDEVGWWAALVELSRRSIIGTARKPQNWLPGMFFPLMLAAVYSSQFAKAVELPAFPFDDISFLDFILPASILQGVAFGSVGGASDLAIDIENGFMDRLVSSPVARPVILLGRLAGSVAFGMTQAVVFLAIFLAFGAELRGGVASGVAIMLVSAGLALGLGGLGAAIALRTGSQEVVQSVFPVIFVMIFVSSAFFPVPLMEGWYGDLAAANPITWIIDPTRRLSVEGFTWADAGQAIGLAAALGAVGIAVAFGQLRRRMAQ